MTTSWLLVLLALALAIAALGVSIRSRDLVLTIVNTTILITYSLDAASTLANQRLLIVLSEPHALLNYSQFVDTMLFLCSFQFLLLLGTIFIARTSPPQSGPAATTMISIRWYIAAIALFSLFAILIPALLDQGIENVLARRQELFSSDNPGLLIAFYAVPTVTYICMCGMVAEESRLRRVTGGLLSLMGLAVVFGLGSRTSLVLACILPAVLLYVHKRTRQGSRFFGGAGRYLSLGAVGLLLIFASTAYLSLTRNVQETANPLEGPDVSQFDVLYSLIAADYYPAKFTYGSAAMALVPRSIFPDKPLPGNVISSFTLSPERYEITGAETTAGLLGEAWINFRGLGVLSAVALLLIYVYLCRRLILDGRLSFYAIGLFLALRGVNLVRGDLTNVVVPILVTVLVALVLMRVDTRKKTEDSDVGFLGHRSSRVHWQYVGSPPGT